MMLSIVIPYKNEEQYIQANIDGDRFNGVAIDNDIVSASIQAVLATVNQKVASTNEQANVA